MTGAVSPLVGGGRSLLRRDDIVVGEAAVERGELAPSPRWLGVLGPSLWHRDDSVVGEVGVGSGVAPGRTAGQTARTPFAPETWQVVSAVAD
ncbi:MAG: hypothetical protein QM692_19665 [Thermomicrobiales bacterium]